MLVVVVGACLLACLPACLPACRRLFWYARQRLTLRHKIFQRRTPPTNESRILESIKEHDTLLYSTIQLMVVLIRVNKKFMSAFEVVSF